MPWAVQRATALAAPYSRSSGWATIGHGPLPLLVDGLHVVSLRDRLPATLPLRATGAPLRCHPTSARRGRTGGARFGH